MSAYRIMRLASRIALTGLLLLLLDTAATALDTAERFAVFRSVNAESKHDEILSGVKHDKQVIYETDAVPLFVIDKNELFLRIQTTHSNGFAVQVETPNWTSKELNQLKHDHPEVIQLLPGPSAPNGGVRWIPLEP